MKILLLAVILIACTKEKKTGAYCYTCEFSRSAAGWQKPKLDTCSDVKANMYHFTDPYNNDLSFFCTPK